jgi:hypothetical protein
VLLVANKLDNPRHDEALEYHELGLGDPFALSALHGIATGDLLDEIVARLRALDVARVERTTDEIGVCILGRPNVGKSSLLNALCDEERTIVSELPGTTRDSIDIRLERGERVYRLIDTAGLAAPHKRQQVEFWERGALASGRSPGRTSPCPDDPPRASPSRTCTSLTARAPCVPPAPVLEVTSRKPGARGCAAPPAPRRGSGRRSSSPRRSRSAAWSD